MNDATVPVAIPINASSMRLPDHSQLHPCLACAQRHANPDLLCLLGHRIRDHAINSQRSQNQSQRGKYSHQQNEEPAW